MKCVCGYEYDYDIDKGWIGEVPFRVLKSTFIYDKDNRELTTYLYACPKCGTVRIKD